MPNSVISEFRTAWLPHASDYGLARITDLLASASPLLIHGSFESALPMGCLASHIAWNHPATQHLTSDAGVRWLTKVAGLNPATSRVILAWDAGGRHDWPLRTGILEACITERRRRQNPDAVGTPVPCAV